MADPVMDEIEHVHTLSQFQLLVLIWLSISLIFALLLIRVALRVYYYRKLLLDDYLLILASSLVVGLGVSHTLSLAPLFSIRRNEPLTTSSLEQFLRAQFTAKIFFWLNFYAVKGSVLSFLRTFLHALPSSRKYWYTAVGLVTIGAAGSFIGSITECSPIQRNFSVSDGCNTPSDLQASRIVLTALSAWDIMSDLVIIALPLPLLISMRRSLTNLQLVSLGSIFCSGGLIVVFAVLRLARIWSNRPVEDFPWQVTIAITWAQVEAAVSIFVGTLPAFKVLLSNRKGAPNSPRGRGMVGSLETWVGDDSQGTTITCASTNKGVGIVQLSECR